MDASAFLSRVRRADWYQDQLVYVETTAPREARNGTLIFPLHPVLQNAIERHGLWPLYSHQCEAINALAHDDNVVVATPAASGKSLCYHIPVLSCILNDRRTRALYVYPTKALAQDQLRSLHDLGSGLNFQASIYDGDTPTQHRPSVKRSTQILLTNPDMLHIGILPNHRTWARFFRGLRYVVLDEAHVYRGVFGSHVANVLRRLRRLCRIYGSSPRFVLCSATIGNPGELAHRLTGLPFKVMANDGAPNGGRRFALWNPPIVDHAKSSRRSTNTEAASLFSELVSSNIRTITFARTRKVAELLYVYARDRLEERRPGLGGQIRPYRASYLPEDRRRIERDLSQGQLMGVATTNALELGIDVGRLDATVITGYPGSISSTLQQAGRSGRREEESLAILVAHNNPLDQYLMHHPEALFGRPTENALISPENPHIFQPHLLCAAYECPMTSQDAEFFGPSMSQHLERLEERGLLVHDGDKWHITPEVTYPAEEVNIRSTSAHNYLVVEEGSGVILETVEEASAFHQLHPGAIYLHQGEPYLVKRLDQASRTARVEGSDGAYYTQVQDMTDINILAARHSKTVGEVNVHLGEVEVTNHVLSYRKRMPFTEEVIGEEPIDLPPQRFNTVALWFDMPDRVLSRAGPSATLSTDSSPSDPGTGIRKGPSLAGGLHAAEHAAIGILPLFALCDRNDIGGVSTPLHPDTGRPQIFIYDGHPGGIGIAERGYEIVEELWKATWRSITECPCTDGCPSCIQSPKCGNNNSPLDKRVAAAILEELCSGTRTVPN